MMGLFLSGYMGESVHLITVPTQSKESILLHMRRKRKI
ncbi:hypothetical protein J2Z26_000049 [Bacillus luteolus]|nr:hypothetical protein [Cytobacillus luteolus]